MNTVGKILVILNFLFAVVVGAFLVVDFATRTNWKTAYDELRRQTEVIKSDREQYISAANEDTNEVKRLSGEVEKLKGQLSDTETAAKAAEQNLTVQLEEATKKAKDADLTVQKALSDVERLKVVESDLKKVIKDREQAVIALQDDVKRYRNEALANEQLAKALADRNQELLTQVQDMSTKINKMLAGGGGTGGTSDTGIFAKNGQEPNPPGTLVKGKIEKVEPSGDLVQISLGTDHGVNKNNTLEVFRTAPTAKYLGMVRIVEAYHNRSVGRLIVPQGTTARPQLKEGDQVWSWLTK
jgi:hypothetical protein